MKDIKIWSVLIIVFITQFLLSDVLTIRYYRPDFIVIYILYFGLYFGPYYGVIAGFCIGLLIDITPMVSYFGISPLTYSLTGFLSGYLQILTLQIVILSRKMLYLSWGHSPPI